ncbi:hypothetical protein GCM10007971_32360 [Oceanobacillus indicireducens]|uniref:Uncharacterized protein n=1 Tax=Oceanobacillus indicireducens TaxID=1004261 RepID=A0A918D3S3_9BACI|nr:hypothetical protein GCM10007971_32360 [Oceanobacillus indicireducens]
MTEKQEYKELQRCLKDNQTISIQKLKRLLETLDFDQLTQSNKDLRRQNQKLRRRIERFKNMEG